MKIPLDIKLTEKWKQGEDRELLCSLREPPGLQGGPAHPHSRLAAWLGAPGGLEASVRLS